MEVPNATMSSNRTSTSLHYLRMTEASQRNNASFQEEQHTLLFVLLTACLSYFFYLCCRFNKTDAANPISSLPLHARKRTASTFKSIEMTSYPTLRGLTNLDGIILQKKHTKKLQDVLPMSLQVSDWSLAFASNRDGYNLETFYRLAENQGPTLLVVVDTAGHVFGGFNSISWECPRSAKGHTYGTGESFVFTVLPEFKHYPWTGANNEFILSRPDCLAFGGGGKFALSMGANFQHGTSDRSETFRNVCLANSTMFDIVSVELWKFNRFR